MKTITEFSGILLRQAAEAQQAYRAAHPQAETAPPEVTTERAPEAQAEAATPTDETVGDAPPAAEAAADDGAAAVAESGGESAGDTAAEPAAEAPALDLGTGPEAEAVGAAMQILGDRLSRLMEALAVAGRRASGVRLVRVLSGENPPANAQKKGDFYYVLDMMPRPESRRDADSRGDDRRGRGGGRDRDSRGGGGRGPGGPGGAGRGPGGGPGGGGGRGPGGAGGRGGRAGGFDALGRDADLPRGEMAKGGEGWMLTRAPDERRGGNRDQVDPTRREQPGRPPRAPRFDDRGARPTGDRPGGDRSAGARPPRGDRPAPRTDRPDRPRGPAGGPGFRAQGPRPGNEAPRGQGPRPGGEQRPPRNGGDDHRRGQGWTAPVRRRGGWDEPMVVEASPAPGATTAPPPPQSTTAAPEITSQPTPDLAEAKKE